MSSAHAPSSPTHVPQECRLTSEFLSRIGDKWSVVIVMTLGQGPHHFNELRRTIGGISHRILVLSLRGLERDGLVRRTVHSTRPVTVEYALTNLGGSLWRPIEALGAWTVANQEAIQAARRRFDSREVQALYG